MFDDLNKKKGDVEDIFADTEQDTDSQNNVEKSEEAKTQIVPPQNVPISKDDSQEELGINQEETNEFGVNKKKKIIKMLVIAVLLILISVGAYFAYNTFIANNEPEIEDNVIVVESELDEEEDNWAELVEPDLIIPEEEEEEEEIIEPIIEEEEEELIDPIWLERIENIKLGLLDSNNDGLSDLSEEYIGTDVNSIDTDGDGYTDLEEIKNGYNPLGEGVLPDGFLVTYYQSEVFEFLYPSKATVVRDSGSKTEVVTVSWPSLNTLDYQIGIYTQENIWQADVFSWYASQFPNALRVDNSRIVNHPNLGTGIIDEDGLAIYFTSADYMEIITISWQEKLELEDYNIISIVMSDLRINK